MGTQGGPEYSGSRDGLVYYFDPKNPACISVPAVVGATIPNMVKSNDAEYGLPVNISSDEYQGINTTAGYISMDGTDDYIRIYPNQVDNHAPAVLETQEFSLSAWVSWTAAGPAGTAGAACGVSSAGNNAGYFLFTQWQLKFACFDTSRTNNFAKFNQTIPGQGDNLMDPDVWYHLVGTKGPNGESNNVNIYVNGTLGDTPGTSADVGYSGGAGQPSGPFPNTAQMGGAWAHTSVGLPWKGDISTVMFYNRGLSASEVVELYNTTKGRYGH